MIPGVNCISSRLHRDSVCSVDCETSVIIISQRMTEARAAFGACEENEEKESGGKALARMRGRVESRWYISVSEVFNSRQSTIPVQKGAGRWNEGKEREGEQREGAEEQSAASAAG